MATQALSAGPLPRRRRAFFGLLDADGWGWAFVKAFFWFIVIIFLLGYIPDRAYYFTVNRTIDLGILAWSPVNFCPPADETLPCPAPQGAVVPWHPSPPELALPAPGRTDGSVAQVGTKMLYVGGSDGSKATSDVLAAPIVQVGNFDKWQKGPSLPAPRADAAVVFLGGSIYAVGGLDEKGAPTATTYVLTPDLQTGALGQWKTAADLNLKIDLPEPRAGGSLVALGDGLLFVGGSSANGPSDAVWKATLDRTGKLGAWTPQAKLAQPTTDSAALLNGNYVWLVGGRTANGVVATVERGFVPNSGAQLGQLTAWATGQGADLPAPRANAASFTANGAIYVVGGTDGSKTHGELYWAIPAAGDNGDRIAEWKHLAQSDLPAAGLEGGATGTSGPDVFIVGGKSGNAVQQGSARANLAPQEPFFQVGLVGATVPALKVDGEIGQQLGYLNAAGAGTVDFIILILIGLAFAHRERTRAIFERIRRRRRAA
jgi:Kelch motif protein